MNYLHKEYYNLKNLEERKQKAKDRMNYDCSIITNLEIKPINQSESFKLFYVPTNDTIDLISDISSLDVKLENLYNKLPEIAQRNFFVGMLSSELHSTNELEGVRSSKEEIVRTTRKLFNKEINVNARFKNVIKSYFELWNGNLKPPVDSKDCRKIYDEITSDGIEKADYPDGKYYRRDITYILRDGKEIHRGINSGDNTEELIIEKMNDLFRFMDKSNNGLNKLIKIAISHYYFGYIHPFYDGNGRTGRFISSIYLKDNYSWLTAMSLSQGCIKERSKYLKVFDSTNQISSQGEINYFVDEFLAIIKKGQEGIIEDLIHKGDLLSIIMEKIKRDETILNSDEEKIMNIMSQEYFFNFNTEGIGVNELQKVFDYTPETLRYKLKNLYVRGLIEKISGKPVKYMISKSYLES